ncbi:MAG: hypothetical protein J6A75_13710 [Lachnospiraceae bacterium]|nr:hypothetical protein [Lachnospiraceae bacterium]
MAVKKIMKGAESTKTLLLGREEVKVKDADMENILASVFGTPDISLSTEASIEYLLARNNLMQGLRIYLGNPFITQNILSASEEGLTVDTGKINRETADTIVRYALFGTQWEDAV